MEPISTGILGCGRWGTKLIEAFLRKPNRFRLQVCCDRNLSKLESVISAHPSASLVTTTSYESLLKDPTLELVVIATQPHLHTEPVRLALEASKNVLCEKPLTQDLRSTEALLNFAASRNQMLLVDYTYLYSSTYRHFKSSVQTQLGKSVFSFSSIRSNASSFAAKLDIVYEMLIHDAVLLIDLFGDNCVEAVRSTGQDPLKRGAVDAIHCELRMKSGWIATLESSFLAPEKIRLIQCQGPAGTISWNDLDSNIHHQSRNITQTGTQIDVRPGESQTVALSCPQTSLENELDEIYLQFSNPSAAPLKAMNQGFHFQVMRLLEAIKISLIQQEWTPV